MPLRAASPPGLKSKSPSHATRPGVAGSLFHLLISYFFLIFLALTPFDCGAYSVPARRGTARYPLNGSRPEVFPDGKSARFAWRRPSHLLPAPRGSLRCEELGCAIAAAGRGSLGSTRERSEPEQFPQALGLSAANRNLGLLLVVHSQLIGTLEPWNDFANAVDIHQVGTVGSPEKIRV